MKHLRILILIPLTLLLTGSVTQQHLMVVARKNVAAGTDSPGTANMVAYWALGEDTTAARVDSHSTHDLTATASIAAAAALIGDGADFEADNTRWLYITDPAAFEFQDTDWSACVWVKFETVSADRVIFSKYLSTAGNAEYMLRLDQSDSTQIELLVSADGTASVAVNATTFGSVTTATWYFVYVYHDATANQIGISINNGTVDTAAHSGGTGTGSGTADFAVGSWNGGAGYMDGIVDELVIFSEVLTAAEVTWIYNSGSGRAYANY